MEAANECKNFFSFDALGGTSLYGVLLSSMYLFNVSLTLYWIFIQTRNAQRGIEAAAQYVIFPQYTKILLCSALADLVLALLWLFLKDAFYENRTDFGIACAVAASYAFQHFVLEGLAALFMQYGCGTDATRKAVMWGFAWAGITFCCKFVSLTQSQTAPYLGFSFEFGWGLSLLMLYLPLWLLPEQRMFRRPAVIPYSRLPVILSLSHIRIFFYLTLALSLS